MVLSADGSTTESVVSNALLVAPSKTNELDVPSSRFPVRVPPASFR
jgi:hypothetical protein